MRSMAIVVLLAAVAGADVTAEYEDLILLVTKPDGVDYEALRARRATLDAFARLPATTTAERINAFNARVLQGVLDGTPAKEITPPVFDDARVAFALHRAARGSPPLAFYKDTTLDGDLTQAVRAFLADREQNELSEARLDAELSMVFRWHRADFVPNLQVFLANHAPRESLRRRLLGSRWRFRYREFDWTLNESGVGPEPEAGASPLLWLYLVPAVLLLGFGVHTFRKLMWRGAGRRA